MINVIVAAFKFNISIETHPGSSVNKPAQNPTGYNHGTHWSFQRPTPESNLNGWDEEQEGWRLAKPHVFMPCTEQIILCLYTHKQKHFSRLNIET